MNKNTIQRLLSGILKLATLLGAGLVVMSFAGWLHPIGDSLAVFRPLIAAGVFVLCLLLWRWRIGWVLAALAMLIAGNAVAQKVGPLVPPLKQGDITLYQKNLLYINFDHAGAVADILAADADFVTLQEVSRGNELIVAQLLESYPHILSCYGAERIGRVVILSRVQIEREVCFDGFGAGMIEVIHNDIPVRIFSLHLRWPWPFNQQVWLDDRTEFLGQSFDGVTLVGGDFNMVPEGASFAQIALLTGTQRVGHQVTTYELLGYPLSIDHVLATGGQGWVEQRPRAGSDHFGLRAHVYLPSAP